MDDAPDTNRAFLSYAPCSTRSSILPHYRYQSPNVYQAQPYNSPYASTIEPATTSTPALKFYFFPLREPAELLATTLGAGVETTVTGGSSPSYQKQATGMRFRFSFGMGTVAWGKLPRWSS